MQFFTNLSPKALVLLTLAFMSSFEGVNGLALPKRAPEPLAIPFKVNTTLTPVPINETSYADFMNKVSPSTEKRDDVPVVLYNRNVAYYASVYVGTPQQEISCDIDTGSSDFWVLTNDAQCTSSRCASGVRYNPSASSTYKDLHKPFHIRYADKTTTDGEFSSDNFSFLPGKTQIQNANFFPASKSSTANCLLGISKNGQESEYSQYQYDNIPARLAKDGVIPKESYSVYLNSADAESGVLLFGGYDKAKIDGNFPKLPIRTSSYLAVSLEGIDIDGSDISLNDVAILDTGTTLTYLHESTFQSLGQLIPGAISIQQYDSDWYVAPELSFEGKKLTYKFDGVDIAIDLSTQISDYYLGYKILNIGSSGEDSPNILGDTFLRHAYVYYDITDNTISLGNIKYTSESNIVSD